MKKYQKSITVYEFPQGFIVERDKKDDCIEFYLSHIGYGAKLHMFGLCDIEENAAEEMMLAEVERHMDIYKEEYFDYEDMENNG